MVKTLYLHIGHYKTGTTALQVFFSMNQKLLLKQGLDYTDTLRKNAKHSRLAFSLYRQAGVETLMHGYADTTPPEDVWGTLFEAVAASPASKILVSTEEFMRLGMYPETADALQSIIEPMRRHIDFRVIAYLRSPGAHLRSWYNQLVKMESVTTDFNSAVCQKVEAVHYDYALALRPWVNIFGAEAVTLRPYAEPLRYDNGLYRDFLPLLGLDYDRPARRGLWAAPEKDVNPRLDDRLLDLARSLHLAGIPKNLHHWVLARGKTLLEEMAVHDSAAEFDAVVAQVRDGLCGLEDMMGGALPELAPLSTDLPVPDAPWRGELAQVMALLLREQTVTRDRLHQSITELRTRISVLEAQQNQND